MRRRTDRGNDLPWASLALSGIDSGPVAVTTHPHEGGSFRVRPKALEAHVRELEALSDRHTVEWLVAVSRAVVEVRLEQARHDLNLKSNLK